MPVKGSKVSIKLVTPPCPTLQAAGPPHPAARSGGTSWGLVDVQRADGSRSAVAQQGLQGAQPVKKSPTGDEPPLVGGRVGGSE